LNFNHAAYADIVMSCDEQITNTDCMLISVTLTLQSLSLVLVPTLSVS